MPSRCRVPRRHRPRFPCALAGHDQQLWRHLQLSAPALGQASRGRESAAARIARDTRVEGIDPYNDSVNRPYIHLVDGGVSDNVGMRGVLDALELLEALHEAGTRRRSTT